MKSLAIITGATSGIGREYAIKLASKGYDLVITGRRKLLLEEVARKIQSDYKVKVTVCLIDFAKTEEFNAFIKFVNNLKKVDFLVNNAGYGLENTFIESSYETNENMIKVHIMASTQLCHSVANKMKKRQSGCIVNVSSLAGFITLPHSAMYCATKAYLINFSQCLAMELNMYGIKVQVLCPGFTHTDFHSKLAIQEHTLKSKGMIRWMRTQEVVQASLNALHKNFKVIVVPGRCNKTLYLFNHLLPKALYYRGTLLGTKILKSHK